MCTHLGYAANCTTGRMAKRDELPGEAIYQLKSQKMMLRIWFIFLALARVNSLDVYDKYYSKCPMLTASGSCCQPSSEDCHNPCSFNATSKHHECTANGVSNAKCLLNGLPNFGFAYPLGFLNGMISASQLTTLSFVPRAFGANAGFPAVSSASSFVIDFQRKRKIMYVIFQEGQTRTTAVPLTPKIIISDANNVAISRVINCKETFGKLEPYSCRFAIKNPFRCQKLQVLVEITLASTTLNPKIEVGGMDYLESDHFWRLDTFIIRPGNDLEIFPDERGNFFVSLNIGPFSAQSTEVRHKDLSADSSFNTAKFTFPADSCFKNLANCQDSITFAFWLKRPIDDDALIEMKDTGLNNIAMRIQVKNDEFKLEAYYDTSSSIQFKTSLSTPTSSTWNHFILVWKRKYSFLYVDSVSKELTNEGGQMLSGLPTELEMKPASNFRNFQIWYFALNAAEASKVYTEGVAAMDFKFTAFEDFGDWKLATSLCSQGPCQDATSSPAAGAATAKLEYRGHVDNSAFYSEASNTCTKANGNSPIPITISYNRLLMMAFNIDLEGVGVEIQRLTSAKLTLDWDLDQSLPYNLVIEIYAVNSYDYNKKYIDQCRFIHLDDDVKTGPVYWDNFSSKETPDLHELIVPFLDRGSVAWRKNIVFVMKFILTKDETKTFNFRDATFRLEYIDGTPEKFLFADLNHAAVGQPLMYTTRFYLPTRKCLKFAYFMNGEGAGSLAVNLRQGDSLFVEIFKLVGSQGDGWKEANVSLNTLGLDAITPFRITFIALGSESTQGSISIDNIKLTFPICSFTPSNGIPTRLNHDTISKAFDSLRMDPPLILAPLTTKSDTDLMSTTTVLTKSSQNLEDKPTTDMFGYPVTFTHFKGASSEPTPGVVKVQPALSHELRDFTITFHVKPDDVLSTVFAQFGNNDGVLNTLLSMDRAGNFSISFIKNETPEGIETATTSSVFHKNSWVYLAITYSKAASRLTVYANATEVLAVNSNGTGQLGNKLKMGGSSEPLRLAKHVCKLAKVVAVAMQLQANVSAHVLLDISTKWIAPVVALINTLYKDAKSIKSFENKVGMRKDFGKGLDFHQSALAYDYLSSITSENQVKYITIPGPINSAICTVNEDGITLLGIQSCIIDRNCNAGFSVSVWVQPPPEKFHSGRNISILDIGAFQLSFANRVCSGKRGYSYEFRLQVGTEICTWHPVSNCISFSRVWTHLVVSADYAKKRVLIVQNGMMMKAQKSSCTTVSPTPTPTPARIGGGSNFTCIDELVVWDQPVSSASAIKLYCSLRFTGMNPTPSTIKFSMASYNDYSGSLWAIDVYGIVYHYDNGVWKQIDGKLKHLSAGWNGVFDNWLKVCSGYIPKFIFLIRSDNFLFVVNLGNNPVTANQHSNHRVLDISCNDKVCWALLADGTMANFFKTDTGIGGLHQFFTKKGNQQLSTGRHRFVIRIKDNAVQWLRPASGELNPTTIDTGLTEPVKHISLMSSDILVVTNDGKIVLIKEDGKEAFSIRHSSGRYLANVESKFALRHDYFDFFKKEPGICLKDIYLNKYLTMLGGKISVQSNCFQFLYGNDSMIRKNGEWSEAMSYGTLENVYVRHSNYRTALESEQWETNAARFYFVFSSLKQVTNFDPTRVTSDSFDGALKVQILVRFWLEDYEFIKSLSEKTGPEAKMIFAKVKTEIGQLFFDSRYYMTVQFDRITRGNNVNIWCNFYGNRTDTCPRPLYVEFTAMILFGHVSATERAVLLSEKFKGTDMDCQGNKCSFQRTGVAIGVIIGDPDIKLMSMEKNGASIRAKFQYFNGVSSVIQAGYKVNLIAAPIIQPSLQIHHSSIIDEGATFFMNLNPYHRVTGTMCPKSLQDDASGCTKLNFTTMAIAPTGMTSYMQCLEKESKMLTFVMNKIDTIRWNGQPQAYSIFYKETAKSNQVDKYFVPCNLTSFSQYKFVEEPVGDVLGKQHKTTLTGLEAFMKYEIYVAINTSMGLGPFAGIICETIEGAPDAAPTNIRIEQIHPNKVNVSWIPLPNDPEVWNSNNEASYGYNLEYMEYTEGEASPALIAKETKDSSLIIEDLHEGRGYKFRIAAKSSGGAGNWSEAFCIRLLDAAPGKKPGSVTAKYLNETAINVDIDALKDLYEENGLIRFYNLTVTERETGVVKIFTVQNDLEMTPKILVSKQNGSAQNSAISCEWIYRENASKSSKPKTFIVPNLKYYTEYNISVSACTEAGCGNSIETLAKTDQYRPTCPPPNATIDVINSTSLLLKWQPLTKSCIHGILTKYRVSFAEENSFLTNNTSFVKFNGSNHKVPFYIDNDPGELTHVHLDSLKEYVRYCFKVTGYTVKGDGPPSQLHCATTLQDRPHGAPTNVTANVTSSRSFNIKMCVPTLDDANGIITQYTVFFKLVEYEDTREENVTRKLLPNATYEHCTEADFDGLRTFSEHDVQVAAWTIIGMGPRSINIFFKTFEDVPSTCLHNITSSHVTERTSIISWLPVSRLDLNGEFRKIKLQITEKLQDGNVSLSRTIYIDASNIFDVFRSGMNAFVNLTDYSNNSHGARYDYSSRWHFIKLVSLKPYASYEVLMSSCTTPGCGPDCGTSFLTNETAPAGVVRNLETKVITADTIGISWKPVEVKERHGLILRYEISWLNECLEIERDWPLFKEKKCGNSLSRDVPQTGKLIIESNKTSVILTNLVPLSTYLFNITAATSKGNGPVYNWSFHLPESAPYVGPVIDKIENTSSTSIKLNWTEIPIEQRNGILIGYVLKYLEAETVAYGIYSYQEVFFPVSNTEVYEYEIVGLQRHTFYNILIIGRTLSANGTATNITMQTGPYVNGDWTLWSEWSRCTQSCGSSGTQKRERSCTNPAPWNGGDDCIGQSHEIEWCNTHLCSGKFLANPNDDCNGACASMGLTCVKDLEITSETKVSDFQQFVTPCSVILQSWSLSANSSLTENTGTCAGKPMLLGCIAYGTETKRRICNCYNKAEIGFGQWAPWSFCTASCGGGIQTSTRTCLLGEGQCSGKAFFQKDCNENPCPVNGNWGQWTEFQKCNQTCGYGYRHRYRKCDSPAAAHGGRNCSGTSVDAEGGCNPQVCPIHGGWSEFGPYGVCTQPCGLGKSIRRRYCNNPTPTYGGMDCEGSATDSLPCNPHQCTGLEVRCKMRIDMAWNYKYVYNEIPMSLDLAEQCRQGVSMIPNISLVKGSVIANFSIYYSAVKNVEVLVLQDTISSQQKVGNLTVTELLNTPESTLPNPPSNLTVIGIGPKTLMITWKFNGSQPTGMNLSSFYAFFRMKDSPVGTWNVVGIPLANRAFNITDLYAVAEYRVRMSVSSTFAAGPASNEVIGKTLEGVPGKTVQGFQIRATQPSEVYAEWDQYPYVDFNGYPRGFMIRYKKHGDTAFKEKVAAYGSFSDTIKGLKPFSFYTFEILAFTNVGRGPPVSKVVKTLEGVPEIPPPNVQAQSYSGTDRTYLKWGSIPDEKTNGVFKGYKIQYRLASVGGRPLVQKGPIKVIETDKFTHDYEITGLQSYSTYEVTVSGSTNAGDGPKSDVLTPATCKCPQTIFLNWYESRPYVIKTGKSTIEGIFYKVLTDTLTQSCGTCNGKASVISPYKSLSGEKPEKTSAKKVMSVIGKEYHVSFPVFGKSDMSTYLKQNVFVALVESPGVAVAVRNDVDYTVKTKAAFNAMINVWPMYIVLIIMTLLAGIFVWFFEHRSNPEFSKDHYVMGILQGCWWAFISATTVGYGDLTPRTFAGRVFGIIWILISLILNGILIGSLTSSVTTMTLPSPLMLYGTKTSAVTNSSEYSLAIRRNCKIDRNVEYEKVDSVLAALSDKHVDIALMDAFVAVAKGKYIEDKKLKVKEIIKTTDSFGFVLSHELVRLEDDFRSQVSTRQDLVAKFVANMTARVQVAEEIAEVILLMDPSSKMFWNVLEFMGILAASFTIGGIIISYMLKWRSYKKYMAIHPDPRASLSKSMDKDVENFENNLQNLADTLDEKHFRRRLELLWIKQNYRRYLKRRANYSVDEDILPKPEI
eukprot:gene1278-15663_t